MSGSFIEALAESWDFGRFTRAARGTPIMLWAFIDGDAAAVRFSTPRRFGAAAGYSVTAGKTLLITEVKHRSTSAPASFGVGYCDADLGMSAAADGANPVNLDGAAADGVAMTTSETANIAHIHKAFYQIPAGKFPRVVSIIDVADHHIWLLGVEV